jgi:hypothetical protein
MVRQRKVTDWLQVNVKGAVSKMDIKICSNVITSVLRVLVFGHRLSV